MNPKNKTNRKTHKHENSGQKNTINPNIVECQKEIKLKVHSICFLMPVLDQLNLYNSDWHQFTFYILVFLPCKGDDFPFPLSLFSTKCLSIRAGLPLHVHTASSTLEQGLVRFSPDLITGTILTRAVCTI